MNSCATDPVALTAALVRCPSITPEEGGALQLLERMLQREGFRCQRVDRNGVPNLHARVGQGSPAVGYAGHTDVVPPGPLGDWTVDPFGGAIHGDMLWGRGAVDMKSSVGAFVAAAIGHVRQSGAEGSLQLLITGDEEGAALDGTCAILDWMRARGETLDCCLVGEPTSREQVGDTIKIGRRGSRSFRMRVEGVAGHSAYPDRARNPLPPLARLLAGLAEAELDSGTERFAPSTLTVTSIDTGNTATNVIPGAAEAVIDIRFNDCHTPEGIGAWLQGRIDAVQAASGVRISVDSLSTSDAFVCEPGPWVGQIRSAVRKVTGIEPALSTSGGTSDARFIKDVCPVAELGLVARGLHAADEHVPVADIRTLSDIYGALLRRSLPTR